MSWVKKAVIQARRDTPLGYLAFYILVQGLKPPNHAMDWIKGLYEVGIHLLGVVIEAFRGSTKTTTANTFVAHQIGLYPQKANLVVTGSDDKATDSGQAIADIIEHNPKWEWVFPHVVPDKKKGWSSSGYEVKRTDIPYGKWRRQNAKRRDPTLLALSYNSRALLGSHPDGVILIDDMNNEQNTVSTKELKNVNTILKETIFPMILPSTRILIIGTPWIENDVIWYVKETGKFVHLFTPGEYEANEEEEIKASITWPEVFPRERLDALKELYGTIGYARMILLSLEAMKGHTLKRHWLQPEFPSQALQDEWGVFLGVDYASTEDVLVRRKKDPDYFAQAWGRITPDGRLVVVDGKRLHVSQAAAEKLVISFVTNTKMLQQIGVESHGEGRGFYNTLFTSQLYMPLTPVTHKRKSKGYRFQEVLAPLFEMGIVQLCDARTEFLNQFIKEWIEFPYGKNDDCLDAVYCLAFVAQPYLKLPNLQRGFGKSPLWNEDKKKESPWKKLVRA